MLTINYFASIREALGSAGEQFELPEGARDVAGLVAAITAERSADWRILLDSSQVLVAVNQTIVDKQHPLQGDEEVAFFPPMTGG